MKNKNRVTAMNEVSKKDFTDMVIRLLSVGNVYLQLGKYKTQSDLSALRVQARMIVHKHNSRHA